MSLNAAALRLMQEKGLTLDDVVEIAAAMEVRRDPTATERKQRQREREAQERDEMSRRDVTRDNKEKAPRPQKEKTPPLNGSPKGEPIPPTLQPEHVLESWNELAERLGLPKARLTPTRQRQLQSRIRGSPDPVADFSAAFNAVERSNFLRGENDRGWRADFDFLLQPKSFAKLIEGSYDH